MKLVSIERLVEGESHNRGRSAAVDWLAAALNTTRGTIYRWLKTGDHYWSECPDSGADLVIKIVKRNEK